MLQVSGVIEPMRVCTMNPRRAPQYLLFFFGLLAYACVLEYTVRSRDWFQHYPYVDNLMHFGWGAVIALGIIIFWRNDARFVLAAVFIWQVAWEFSEIIGDRLLDQPLYMHDHLWPDGLIDTGLDLLGAAAALWLTRPSRRMAIADEPA